MPQDIVLVDSSIRANVVFGSAEIDDDRLASALSVAQLDSFVASLPDGLDTVVGELGVRLSGGQRQRLGLARALYRRPKVLILDEATSAVDSATESRIMSALGELAGTRTVLIVSHRLSALTKCDRIYYLRDGHIVGSGSLTELGEMEPDFARLTF